MTDSSDAADIVEIRDPAIDSEAIMRHIRDNIQKRRSQAESRGMNYDAFVQGLYIPNGPSRFNHSLYQELRRMSIAYGKTGVGLALTESCVPVIGPLLQRVRTALHQLVIYYVNMLAGQQSRFNEYTVRALSVLVQDLESEPKPSDLETLRAEIVQLRAYIESLESKLENTRA